MWRVFLTLATSLGTAMGCYSTTYYNFAPAHMTEPQHTGSEPSDMRYWRNFWVFGWAPEAVRIDAAAACGGAEHIDSLRTERSLVQGLVSVFAANYINIYSPYSARVVCDHGEPELEVASISLSPTEEERVVAAARSCLENAEDGYRYSIEDVKISDSKQVGDSYIAHIDYVVIADRTTSFKSTTGKKYILPRGRVEGGVPTIGRFKLLMKTIHEAPKRRPGVVTTRNSPKAWVMISCERT